MTIVTPVKYDPEQKTHTPFRNGDTVNPNQVPVSKDGGNQIQVREDGIYYGTSAPASVNPLYVSASGNDSNDGLSANTPLLTIDAALAKQTGAGFVGDFTIFLKAGETFNITKNAGYPSGSNLYFQYYGDPKFGQQTSIGSWSPQGSVELSRPSIVIDTVIEAGTGLIDTTGFSGISKVTFMGVTLVNKDTAGYPSNGTWKINCDTMEFNGSNIVNEATQCGIGSATTVGLLQSVLTQSGTSFFFITNGATGIMNQAEAGGTVAQPPSGATGPATTSQTSNVTTVLKTSNAVNSTTSDATTKTQFGYSTNWDIFANS